MTSVVRELDRCVFCDDTDMSEAHLIADWAHRAFARKRKPDTFLSGTFSGSSEFRVHTVATQSRLAKVICRTCNNGWLSKSDNAASQVLRPLVRGEREMRLDRAQQRAVAAWIYKTALIVDAAEHGRHVAGHGGARH
jgi:hypothetical protein